MWWILLLILAFLLYPVQEPFKVHIEAELPSMRGMTKNIQGVTEGVQNYTTRPLYKHINSWIPYKDVFRKVRRAMF
jgi:hypothetical protein